MKAAFLCSGARPMISRIISPALFMIGLALLGVAGYLALQPEFYVDAPQLDQEFDVAVGQDLSVTVLLVNRSSRPVRVLGVSTC